MREIAEVMEAVRAGEVPAIKKYLDEGNAAASLGLSDEWGNSMLHYAANSGNVELVDMLLDYAANPNVQSTDGLTPLHLACHAGHSGVVTQLLERGALPTVEDTANRTAMAMAVDAGHLGCVELLARAHSSSADTTDGAVSPASMPNLVPTAPSLGHKPDEASVQRRWDGQMLGPEPDGPSLPSSVSPQHRDEVAAVDPEALGRIIAACSSGNTDVVFGELANEPPPDLSQVGDHGDAAIHASIRAGQIDIFRLLVVHGASPFVRNEPGHRTCLHVAVEEGHEDAVVMLVREFGLPIDAADSFGMTPLHIAAAHGQRHMLQAMLWGHPASLEKLSRILAVRDQGERIPAALAAWSKHDDCADLLRRYAHMCRVVAAGSAATAAASEYINSTFKQRGYRQLEPVLVEFVQMEQGAVPKTHAAQERHLLVLRLFLAGTQCTRRRAKLPRLPEDPNADAVELAAGVLEMLAVEREANGLAPGDTSSATPQWSTVVDQAREAKASVLVESCVYAARAMAEQYEFGGVLMVGVATGDESNTHTRDLARLHVIKQVRQGKLTEDSAAEILENHEELEAFTTELTKMGPENEPPQQRPSRRQKKTWATSWISKSAKLLGFNEGAESTDEAAPLPSPLLRAPTPETLPYSTESEETSLITTAAQPLEPIVVEEVASANPEPSSGVEGTEGLPSASPIVPQAAAVSDEKNVSVDTAELDGWGMDQAVSGEALATIFLSTRALSATPSSEPVVGPTCGEEHTVASPASSQVRTEGEEDVRGEEQPEHSGTHSPAPENTTAASTQCQEESDLSFTAGPHAAIPATTTAMTLIDPSIAALTAASADTFVISTTTATASPSTSPTKSMPSAMAVGCSAPDIQLLRESDVVESRSSVSPVLGGNTGNDGEATSLSEEGRASAGPSDSDSGMPGTPPRPLTEHVDNGGGMEVTELPTAFDLESMLMTGAMVSENIEVKSKRKPKKATTKKKKKDGKKKNVEISEADQFTVSLMTSARRRSSGSSGGTADPFEPIVLPTPTKSTQRVSGIFSQLSDTINQQIGTDSTLASDGATETATTRPASILGVDTGAARFVGTDHLVIGDTSYPNTATVGAHPASAAVATRSPMPTRAPVQVAIMCPGDGSYGVEFYPESQGGAVVTEVKAGSPADLAGLCVDDLLVVVDGRDASATSLAQLTEILQTQRGKEPVRFEVMRTAGAAAKMRSLYEKDGNGVKLVTVPKIRGAGGMGFSLTMTEKTREVVIKGVVLGGAAEEAGLRNNDVVIAAAGKTMDDFKNLIEVFRFCKMLKETGTVPLRIERRSKITVGLQKLKGVLKNDDPLAGAPGWWKDTTQSPCAIRRKVESQ
eukprot:m.343978 g.343978  ORF g.343978 m.343978 type:complete len:1348 (+) comp27874_c1_seq2:251-4294(+)